MIDPVAGQVIAKFHAAPIHIADIKQWWPVGHQVVMNECLYFHITPETARQWVQVLEQIATKEDA
ncbi:hypothetical protein [Pseudarthrobacter sp. PS3-L1]|uniref:hypothetical protein n=1 Tax=Pseudarthrobacter sp. PS3-L1 TaxID=3046207 RepID=UPI0024B8E59D|nr:hypothetical protein [Pseudarthrobacter sp. PS3-L1]MDJ0321682.1 hypothetical protein [Pseudarthrobacter sp. PS3-L1]